MSYRDSYSDGDILSDSSTVSEASVGSGIAQLEPAGEIDLNEDFHEDVLDLEDINEESCIMQAIEEDSVSEDLRQLRKDIPSSTGGRSRTRRPGASARSTRKVSAKTRSPKGSVKSARTSAKTRTTREKNTTVNTKKRANPARNGIKNSMKAAKSSRTSTKSSRRKYPQPEKPSSMRGVMVPLLLTMGAVLIIIGTITGASGAGYNPDDNGSNMLMEHSGLFCLTAVGLGLILAGIGLFMHIDGAKRRRKFEEYERKREREEGERE